MIATATILGLVVATVCVVLILLSLARNPRLWLGDAPREMQEAARPLDRNEQVQRLAWGIPLVFIMLGIIPAETVLYHKQTGLSYMEAFAMMWIAWMIVNLADLLIVDWLVVVLWKPPWSVIKEVEHLYHLNTPGFHLRCFLKGTLGITIASACLALFVFLI